MTDSPTDPIADLHVHTTHSDGVLTFEDLPQVARAAGLTAVAVTDHDRLHPAFERPIVDRHSITLIRGIEVKVERDSGDRIDLLGYAARDTDRIQDMIDRVQNERIDRARRIRERLEERLGIDLELELTPGVGRPHIARAIAAHPHTHLDVQGAFDELIGDDGPCYVPRAVPSYPEGAEILQEACSVVSVAHPLRYPDVAGAIECAIELGAIERWYPYGTGVDRQPVSEAIERHDLLCTGGSDAHGETLGDVGVPKDSYPAIRRALKMT